MATWLLLPSPNHVRYNISKSLNSQVNQPSRQSVRMHHFLLIFLNHLLLTLQFCQLQNFHVRYQNWFPLFIKFCLFSARILLSSGSEYVFEASEAPSNFSFSIPLLDSKHFIWNSLFENKNIKTANLKEFFFQLARLLLATKIRHHHNSGKVVILGDS